MRATFGCFLLILTTFLSTASFAIFCPNSFNSVNLGDSIAEVTRVCGPPASQRTYKQKAPAVEEWNYYIQPLFGGQDVVTMKFVVKDNRVLNINITGNPDPNAARLCNDAFRNNDQAVLNSGACNNPLWQRERNVSNTQLCGPTILNVGDPAERVQMACGKPAFVKTYDQTNQDNTGGGPQITEFTYDSNPPVTFVFQNGTFTDRQ